MLQFFYSHIFVPIHVYICFVILIVGNLCNGPSLALYYTDSHFHTIMSYMGVESFDKITRTSI